MELGQLIDRQISADHRRGFTIELSSDRDRHDQLMRDLVGLMGEVGEFANLLKKVGLAQSVLGYDGPGLNESAPRLREELVDAVIYIFLSSLLGGDLEADLLAKMRTNDERYARLAG